MVAEIFYFLYFEVVVKLQMTCLKSQNRGQGQTNTKAKPIIAHCKGHQQNNQTSWSWAAPSKICKICKICIENVEHCFELYYKAVIKSFLLLMLSFMEVLVHLLKKLKIFWALQYYTYKCYEASWFPVLKGHLPWRSSSIFSKFWKLFWALLD